MDLFRILAVYLTQVLAGWLVVEQLAGRAFTVEGPGKLARCLLLGPAVLALQMMAYHLVGTTFSLPAVLLPWWLIALFRHGRVQIRPRPSGRASRAESLLIAGATVLFLVLLWQGLRIPVYHGDEINNFAVNARVFEVHRSLAPEALASMRAVGHPEYPPLIALNETLLFLAQEAGFGYAVKPFFALAWLAWALLVVELVGRRLPPLLALSVGTIALAVPELFDFALGGKGDLRLIAGLLFGVLEGRAFLSHRAEPSAGRRFFAFGAAAVTCGLTKNEGLALATLGVLALLPTALRHLSPARAVGCAGLTLAVVWSWPAFKLVHGIRDVYLAKADPTANLNRVGEIAATLIGHPFRSELGPAPTWGVLSLVAPLALLVGFAVRPSRRRELGWLAAGLALHFLLYVAVFAATPRDLDWHLETAGPRLLFHLAPWLVVILAAATLREPPAAVRARGSAGPP
jgi:hypothetical protein